MGGRVEYRGCTAGAGGREYALHVVWPDGGAQDVVLVIAHEAFRGGVGYQDGPAISYHVLQHLMTTQTSPLADPRFLATEADVQGYREAHAPKPRASRAAGRPLSPPDRAPSS